MRFDLIRSTPGNDRTAVSSEYEQISSVRPRLSDDNCIYNHFTLDIPGDAPHARISLDWADVEAIIDTFIRKKQPEALRLSRARKLASAVDEFVKNSD